MTLTRLAVLPATALLLAGCAAQGDLAQTAAQEQPGGESSAQVEVSKDVTVASVQLEPPADGDLAAGDDAGLRLEVSNTGDDDDELQGVSGPDFGTVVGGPWAVPAQGGLSASAAGPTTLTLRDLADGVRPGDSVEVTFTFERSGAVTLSVPSSG